MKKEYEKYVGKSGTVYIGGLEIEVLIIDIKNAWGSLRLLVSPLSGSGEIWKDEKNVSIFTEEEAEGRDISVRQF